MKIKVYTDGSCKPNPGLMGVGIILVADGKVLDQKHVFLDHGTNQIAELQAVNIALDLLKEKGWQDEEIELTTDSSYAVGLFMKNWKAKANRELVAEVRQKLDDFPNLIISWVKGHDGNIWNEKADKLANLAVDLNK